jgi:hypothetical protein
MIEVIVKFLMTSASKKASTTSHATTPTKSPNPKGGMADLTPQEEGGAHRTPRSDVPTHTEGLSSSMFGKSQVYKDIDVDTQIATPTSKMGSIFQHGKPITSFPTTTNPITHDFSRSHPTPSRLSEVSPSALSHLDKPTYPQTERSPLRESTRHGETIEPRKHSATSLQKEKTSVVCVKPRGDVRVQPSSRGSSAGAGGVINVASGHTVGPRPVSSSRSSARGVHTSLQPRETPTRKSTGSRAESTQLKPYQGRNTYVYRDEASATVTQDDSNSTLVTVCKCLLTLIA